MTRAYRFACKAFTADVETDDAGVILNAPAIAHQFIGRTIGELEVWMRRYGGFEVRTPPAAGSDETGTASDSAGNERKGLRTRKTGG